MRQVHFSSVAIGFVGIIACGSPPPAVTAQATPVPSTTPTPSLPAPRPAARVADVSAARLLAADKDRDNWLTHGRTYDEQRFSPLDQVNAGNVASLGLAWALDLDTDRGQEATPLVVDGVMYSTSAWSKVQAIDAASGKLLWQYDPKVPGPTGVKACCDVVNRGVAVYQGRLYLGTLDGRLVALDAATGKEVWSVVTVDQTKKYTITGAPRIVKRARPTSPTRRIIFSPGESTGTRRETPPDRSSSCGTDGPRPSRYQYRRRRAASLGGPSATARAVSSPSQGRRRRSLGRASPYRRER